KLHDEKTKEFLTSMVKYVKTHYSKSLHAFLMGYILHYTLDVKIHPYVYHHVGVFDKNDPKTYNQRGLHLKFERRMDKCLIEKDHGIK
ncbi:zinc dependent phospholipase C family protein, partial [Methanocalculus natronophilus]|uniref:zinc dependent phospholipase C family protein n=1 Tax=Methanocalculus natronophilus TaxID=1262400 RepID=UPI0031B62A73